MKFALYLLIFLQSCFNLLSVNFISALDRFPSISPYHTGMLQVDEIHTLYWEESGNPSGVPILFLHGGPGVGTEAVHRTFFDPAFYRIILFDQRGCGKSTPRGCLIDNTTWDLVEDINKLLDHLSVNRCVVFGGSWGSTLALTYAIQYPEKVLGLILRGIFFCSQSELDWFYREGASLLSPKAWQKFVEAIPEQEREDLIAAYQRYLSDGSSIRTHVAATWVLWEFANLQSEPDYRLNWLIDYKFIFYIFSNLYAEQNLVQASIENHYFFNKGFFVRDNWILENIERIHGIPGIIIQGERDQICPKEYAQMLHENWSSSILRLIPNMGHASTEPEVLSELIQATEEFKTIVDSIY